MSNEMNVRLSLLGTMLAVGVFAGGSAVAALYAGGWKVVASASAKPKYEFALAYAHTRAKIVRPSLIRIRGFGKKINVGAQLTCRLEDHPRRSGQPVRILISEMDSCELDAGADSDAGGAVRIQIEVKR